jgi:hypothetical protein
MYSNITIMLVNGELPNVSFKIPFLSKYLSLPSIKACFSAIFHCEETEMPQRHIHTDTTGNQQ